MCQAGPVSEITTIVGAAILDSTNRLLGAERALPIDVAGLWEFPGGKVEPNESEHDALIRECQEELDVTIEVGDRLGEDILLPAGWGVLKVWFARITHGEPRPLDHASLRWLAADELDAVPWLPADLPLISELGRVLSHRS